MMMIPSVSYMRCDDRSEKISCKNKAIYSRLVTTIIIIITMTSSSSSSSSGSSSSSLSYWHYVTARIIGRIMMIFVLAMMTMMIDDSSSCWCHSQGSLRCLFVCFYVSLSRAREILLSFASSTRVSSYLFAIIKLYMMIKNKQKSFEKMITRQVLCHFAGRWYVTFSEGTTDTIDYYYYYCFIKDGNHKQQSYFDHQGKTSRVGEK